MAKYYTIGRDNWGGAMAMTGTVVVVVLMTIMWSVGKSACYSRMAILQHRQHLHCEAPRRSVSCTTTTTCKYSILYRCICFYRYPLHDLSHPHDPHHQTTITPSSPALSSSVLLWSSERNLLVHWVHVVEVSAEIEGEGKRGREREEVDGTKTKVRHHQW